MSSKNLGRIFPHEQPNLSREGFGDNVNRIGKVTIPLDNAYDLKEFSALIGNFLYVESATSKGASVDVHFNDQYQSALTLKEGMFIAGLRFDKVFLSSTAQAGESITVVFGIEDGNLRIENPADLANDVDVSKSSDFVGVADVSVLVGATQIVPADATRRKVHIFNTHATDAIRIGGNGSTAAAQGTLLPAGMGITIESTDEIQGIRTGANDVTVAISVEND